MLEQLLQPVKDYVNGLQTVAELDGVLSHLDVLVLSLRIRRNQGVLLASQTPAEILSEIFQYAVADDLDRCETTVKQAPKYPQMLFTLRRVCARWRAVTRDFPNLWTMISCDYSPRIVQMMVSTSASLPLTIKVSQGDYWDVFETVDFSPNNVLLGPVFFRLQDLIIHTTMRNQSEDCLTRILGLSIPGLQSLKFDSKSGFRQRLTSLLSVVQRYPRLRALHLTGVDIVSIHDGSAASSSHGLASLCLYSANIPGTHRQALLCIAQCFPRLLALLLEFPEWSETGPVDTCDHSLPISFPCLGSMALDRLPSSLCVDILGQVKIPAHCHISISVDFSLHDSPGVVGTNDMDEADNFENKIDQHVLNISRSLLEFYDAHLRRDVAQHRLYTAEFDGEGRTDGQLFALYDAQEGCIFLPCDRDARHRITDLPVIEVMLSELDITVSWSDILWPSISAFDSVQTLRLLSCWEGDTISKARENWELLQRLYPNISAIGIEYQHMTYYAVAQEYLGALQIGRSVCFPSLQHLTIYYSGASIAPAEQDAHTNEMFEFIYSCLASRQSNGHPWRGMEIFWYHWAHNGLPSDGAADTFLQRCAQYSLDEVSILYFNESDSSTRRLRL